MNEVKKIPVSDGNEAGLNNEDALQTEQTESVARDDVAVARDDVAVARDDVAVAQNEVRDVVEAEVVDEAVAAEDEEAVSGDDETALEPSVDDQVKELEEKLAAMQDRLLRTAAELDNVRKRSRREIDEATIKGRSDVLREILPVMDSIDMAISTADPEGTAAAIVEGVEMVRKQFFSATERFELKAVETVGKAFDPNFHEAVAQIPSPDFETGQIVEEMRKGYVLGSRLLRAALVVVSSGAPVKEAAPAESENGEEAEVEATEVGTPAEELQNAPDAPENEVEKTTDVGDGDG